MKKWMLLSALSFLLAGTTLAQRIAYINMDRILPELAEYKKAQEELDRLSQQWQQEIAQEYDKIKGMYNDYQANQVLMSDDMRNKREDEIMQKEAEVRDLQRRRFGPEGELFQRRKQLVEPIQDKVYSAIKNYAEDKGYDFIFDVSSPSSGMIFFNERYDKTDDIRKALDID